MALLEDSVPIAGLSADDFDAHQTRIAELLAKKDTLSIE